MRVTTNKSPCEPSRVGRPRPLIKTIFPFAGISNYAPKQNHESRLNCPDKVVNPVIFAGNEAR
jgi:hypothetical protein